ncbi:MAG TPA: hypothetical protein VHW96_19280 [Solirubrobacteraceae bacterium]|nr:hypothetical protein [Solirubrobacteraceae bacterium]
MHTDRLVAIASTALLIAGSGIAAASTGPASPRSATAGGGITWNVRGRPPRPNRADWERIRAAAGLRRLALAPHRSAHFRAYAAGLGLSELTTIRPLGPGPCATAVTYLYDNLLDLHQAAPGENWSPLRRLVAQAPPIRACAPPQSKRIGP